MLAGRWPCTRSAVREQQRHHRHASCKRAGFDQAADHRPAGRIETVGQRAKVQGSRIEYGHPAAAPGLRLEDVRGASGVEIAFQRAPAPEPGQFFELAIRQVFYVSHVCILPRARLAAVTREGTSVQALEFKNQTCLTWLDRREPYIPDATALVVAPCCKPQPGLAPGSFLGGLQGALQRPLKSRRAAPRLITVEVLVHRKGGSL